MYGKLKQHIKNTPQKHDCQTIVGTGSSMKGEISCKGPSCIAGNMEGDVSGDDQLVIDQEASITGKVNAVEIEIFGTITGTLSAKERIILRETAHVEGDIHSPSVIIEEGAKFNGTSHMLEKIGGTGTDNVHTIDAKKSSEKTVTSVAS